MIYAFAALYLFAGISIWWLLKVAEEFPFNKYIVLQISLVLFWPIFSIGSLTSHAWEKLAEIFRNTA